MSENIVGIFERIMFISGTFSVSQSCHSLEMLCFV